MFQAFICLLAAQYFHTLHHVAVIGDKFYGCFK